MIDSIRISVRQQALHLSTPTLKKSYRISTARNGIGQSEGSFSTPVGHHIVKEKIGYGAPPMTSFVGRTAEPDLFSKKRQIENPERDWILSRILWLSGCEPGINRLGRVDTKNRYIYIHGTPEIERLGEPCSHGCIRMDPDDIVELFEHTPLYTQVLISE